MKHWPEYLCEFIGTAILLLGGVSAVYLNFGTHTPIADLDLPYSARLLLTGFLFAGTGTLVVYSPLGQRSGGHLNPVISLGFFILKKLKAKDMVMYVVMQFLGAATGAYLASHLYSGAVQEINLAMTLPDKDYSTGSIFLFETLATGLLVSLIFVVTSIRVLARFTGVFAGLLVACEVYVIAGITGASMNPARSFGPAFIVGNFDEFWIYLTAPLVASIIVSVLFKTIFFDPLCGKLFHPHQDTHCIFKCNY